MDLDHFLKLKNKISVKKLNFMELNLAGLDEPSFKEFCVALSQCRALESLTFQYSFIGWLDAARFKTLSEALSHCVELQELSFYFSDLDYLETGSFESFCDLLSTCCHIRALRLSGYALHLLNENQFESMMNVLSQYSKIQSLGLIAAGVGHLDENRIKKLCFFLSHCKNLRHLDLYWNQFDAINPKTLEALGDALSQCPALESLNFWDAMNLHWNETCYQAFCNLLSRCRHLRFLSLRHNNLGHLDEHRLNQLDVALSQCIELESLDLWDNDLHALDGAAMKSFCRIFSNCPELTCVELGENDFSRFSEENLRTLAVGLIASQKWRIMDLTDVNLGNLSGEVFEEFCSAISECHSLQSLSIGRNDLFLRFNDHRFLFLCIALSKCTELRILSFEGELLMNSDEYEKVKQLLSFCPQIHWLKIAPLLNTTLLGDPISSFCKIFSACPALQSLTLQFFDLDHLNEKDFDSVRKSLSQCSQLLFVDGCEKMENALELKQKREKKWTEAVTQLQRTGEWFELDPNDQKEPRFIFSRAASEPRIPASLLTLAAAHLAARKDDEMIPLPRDPNAVRVAKTKRELLNDQDTTLPLELKHLIKRLRA